MRDCCLAELNSSMIVAKLKVGGLLGICHARAPAGAAVAKEIMPLCLVCTQCCVAETGPRLGH